MNGGNKLSGKYDFKLNINNDNNSHSMILKQIKPNTTVLEFGPSNGIMTKYMQEELNCEVYIVEGDENSYNNAIKYSKNGVLGDIEDYTWAEEFKNIKFNYIIFADVLEHLNSPDNVLNHANALLQYDGRILISVPNMAYIGIIAELYENKFHYRETGLLDSAHRHFFSYFSLCEMFEKTNNVIEIYDATYNSVENSEFKDCLTQLPQKLVYYLRKKSLSNVYQFIFTIIKKDYYESNKKTLNIINNLNYNLENESHNFKIYIDYGYGFSEKDIAIIENKTESEEIDISFKIPENAINIRFDPVEGKICIIKNLEIFADYNKIKDFVTNGISIYNGIMFDSLDPQVLIRNVQDVKKINIYGQFVEVSDYDVQIYKEKIKETNEKINNLNDTLNNKIIYLEEQRGKIDEQRSTIDEQRSTIEKQSNEMEQQNSEFKNKLAKLENELNKFKTHYFAAINQREELKKQVALYQAQYNNINNAFFWKITKPLRVISDFVQKILNSNRHTKLLVKGLRSLRNNGFYITKQKTDNELKIMKTANKIAEKFSITNEERKLQENTNFNRNIKFSILVPLYNTPLNFLDEMIDSVIKQTYQNWELCMADGSDNEHSYVRKYCQKIIKKDNRIKYEKLEKNLGISENTNACIKMSTGDYVGLFDHDDLLHPSVLFEVMKAICDKDADFIYTDENTFNKTPNDAYCPNFKPDFSPDTLRSYNYICHFTIFKKDLLNIVGNFRPEFDGSQDYDMILRLTEKAKHIVHIPKILYCWRAHKNSVASDINAKPYAITAAKKALDEHIKRIGLKGKSIDSKVLSTYKIEYEINKKPLISIIIPNKDHVSDLKQCLDSIIQNSTYKNYEIIIVENNSSEKETFEYYKSLETFKNIKIVKWSGKFNYSAINNFGFSYTKGEYLILLNNDIKIITPKWIEEMLMFAQRKDVGAVGCMLYYNDDTIQHAGVILGLGGVAGHSHKNYRRGNLGYMYRLTIAQNLNAVTAACMMMSRKVFKEVKGFDESFEVAFNDVDLCMRIRQAGYLIVFTPYAEAYHFESKSRGYEDTYEKKKRFEGEVLKFREKWKEELEAGDPYYNPNLTLDREDFSVK
jgi:GT2 family glycosyltransferase/2-polyprenyl-3-methyl-5-hydroxy-6-metoxy-1,4-benzoquinol methylase